MFQFLFGHVTSMEQVLVSIVASIPACHAGDRGSIPRRGEQYFSRALCTLIRFTGSCKTALS